jgi:alpha-glucosidase
MDDFLWWRDGVIYQIYPRSFVDTDGDGLGDLPGIISRLDYLADLGIDAVWLSPIYPSPDKDFGYDISDYLNIDPRFGSLEDFDWLVKECHRRGIRVVMDMVMNHTSDQHSWFKSSRSSREDPRRDWYIWKDPRSLGSVNKPPNNWQASFGGKAWEYDPPTGQYYLHLFTREQPDLNWRNPQVRQALLDAFRFWMERGADGFRLDVFNAYFKHPDLPDNPPKPGLRAFDRQKHLYDIDQPAMVPLLQDLRTLLDSFSQRYAVGETYLASPQKIITYCGPDKLHAAFSFDFTPYDFVYPFSPRWIMNRIRRRESIFNPADLWPTIVMSNHDIPRAASRYTLGEKDDLAKIAMAVLLTLRGTPFIYYGEEIGMRDIHLRHSEILDPPGKKYWPIYKGRDGCRSPMQWDGSMNAGFSSTKPWLPLNPDYGSRNVTAQLADPASILNYTKKLIALRRKFPALRSGKFIPLKASGGILAYLRSSEEQVILVVVNFAPFKRRFKLPAGRWEELDPNPNDSYMRILPLLSHQVKLLILKP